MAKLNDTAEKILDVAEEYTQTAGFNAFSYKDIQGKVGIKTSSIHYHFPTKLDLADAMTQRYIEHFAHHLEELKAQHPSALDRLNALGQIFVNVLKQEKFCMCGMLASDMASLPDVTIHKLNDFFKLNADWIEETIKDGQQDGTIIPTLKAQNIASMFLAVLEGGMLISRTHKETQSLEANIKQVIQLIQHQD